MGSTWNPDLVRRAGGVQGREARYITQSGKSMFPMLMVWGPQADLARDPRWGRAEEVYGEDPFFNGVMATAFARGIQGDDPTYWQAAPLLKHFLANSNENGRMSSDSRFDERLFWEYYSVPFRMAFQDAGPAPWANPEHLAISKTMALESIVLLKNDGGALPLRKDALKSVAVIGPRADSVHWDWYGGTPPHATTPLQGIRDAVGPAVTVSYAPDDEAGAAVNAARAADVAIVVVGNHPTCGPNMGKEWTKGGDTQPCADPGEGREGRDRETLALSQEELVRKVHAANPRTVMVLVSSFPYTITWSQEHVPAIVHTAHSSQDEGWALAQVLFGDENPGGHTVFTWPASFDELPPMMDYDIRHGRTYMYARGTPLYPFGHGLSYTTFDFARLRTDKPALARDGQLEVSVDVTNTGKVAGDAVPQLYVQHLGSKVARPAQQLAGFRRVHRAPGETKTVRIPLKAQQLAYWDTGRKAFVVEPEPVRPLIGASSADIRLRAETVVQ